jgi:serine-type D-Ala-D-Ala carboxypeptidase (penicillin-binding protein 5/6)
VTFRLLTLAAVLLALWTAQPALAQTQPPALPTAQSAIVIDASDGDVMFAKDARERRQMASTTKLMTALITLERARLREVFTSPGYNPLPAESRINLRAGERMRVEDLLEALLLESANDAAVTLAEGVSGSREAFVEDMNEEARELGLDDTSYANPIGLDDPMNYSTASDLAKLSRRLMRNRTFARIVDMPMAVLETGARRRVIDNRNGLVAHYPFVDGIKTGHTIQAGYILVGAASDRRGNRVISVVMGESSESARDVDTLALLRWGLGRFKRVQVLDRNRVMARASIEHRDEEAELVPARNLTVTVRQGEKLRRVVDAPDEVEGPLPKGERVGTVTVLVDGKPVRRIALETATEVPGAGTLRVLFSVLGVPLTLLLSLGILLAVLLVVLRFRVRMRLVREGKGRERRPTTRAR